MSEENLQKSSEDESTLKELTESEEERAHTPELVIEEEEGGEKRSSTLERLLMSRTFPARSLPTVSRNH